jgi:hypothetical protein
MRGCPGPANRYVSRDREDFPPLSLPFRPFSSLPKRSCSLQTAFPVPDMRRFVEGLRALAKHDPMVLFGGRRARSDTFALSSHWASRRAHLGVPPLQVSIRRDAETKESVIGAVGELHLEVHATASGALVWGIPFLHTQHTQLLPCPQVCLDQLRELSGVEVTATDPVVALRETVGAKGPALLAKSANKHNRSAVHVLGPCPRYAEYRTHSCHRFWVSADVLDSGATSAALGGDTAALEAAAPARKMIGVLPESAPTCLFVDGTTGAQHLGAALDSGTSVTGHRVHTSPVCARSFSPPLYPVPSVPVPPTTLCTITTPSALAESEAIAELDLPAASNTQQPPYTCSAVCC